MSSPSVKAVDHFKKGDIVYNSWGVGQTNIEFYEVVKVNKATVTLQGIASAVKTEMPSDMCGYTTPVAGKRQGHYTTNYDADKLLLKKVFVRDDSSGEPYLSFKYGCGCKWDGKPKYTSWYN